MKRIKIASITLAFIIFCCSTFTNSHSANTASGGIYRWFEYNGYGDPFDPSSYSLVSFAPECNNDIYLCAIYSKCDMWSWLPMEDNLLLLGISSDMFTQPYNGVYGQVLLKDF